MNTKYIFFALAPTGTGISGSDRIFIELARQWSTDAAITIFTTQEGVVMLKRQKLSGKHLKVRNLAPSLPNSFILKYVYKIFLGIKLGLTLPLTIDENSNTIVYSSSDFWMDVLPAVILKARKAQVSWLATWYQTAPNPLKGFSEAERKEKYNISAFSYWFSQLPIKPLIKKYANWVVVNNQDERKQFKKMDKKGKVVVLLGAVRLDEIKRWRKTHKRYEKVYSAVFQGRFHPQKGVVELVRIWRYVVDRLPGAKLAMIGDGPLRKDVEKEIVRLNLKNSIKLFGYIFDGSEKYRIFDKSLIVVHPAYYDSGGMASAEAMAFGSPAVGFDLKAYRSYYPVGMVKVRKLDTTLFAREVIKLLTDVKFREKIGKEAYAMIEKNWSWEKRALQLRERLNYA